MKKFFKAVLLCVFFITFLILVTKLFPLLYQPKEEKVEEEIKGETIHITASIKLQSITFKVYPERRVPPTGNWSTILDFQVQNQLTHSPFLQKTLTTNNSGVGVITLGADENLPPGNNSIWIKGISHLAKRYDNMYFSDQYENFDFTPYGDLLAGDTHISSDNFINSLDISTLINQLNTGNYKNDLNQDSTVNILDLTIQVDNISKGGDA